jgi:hypothetical protein
MCVKYICASEARRIEFSEIQMEILSNPERYPELKKWIVSYKRPLLPILDVKTRWDSTTSMCLRLRILRRALTEYFNKDRRSRHSMLWLLPSASEWQTIEYLIMVTAPFNQLTQLIGASTVPTIHSAYDCYDVLFSHLEKAQKKLRGRTPAWKNGLSEAIEASVTKLKKYYNMTETNESLELLYAFSKLLHPGQHLEAFTSASWLNEESRNASRGRAGGTTRLSTNSIPGSAHDPLLQRNEYKDALRKLWVSDYKPKVTDQTERPRPRPQKTDSASLLASMKKNILEGRSTQQSNTSTRVSTYSDSYDELEEFWKNGVLLYYYSFAYANTINSPFR